MQATLMSPGETRTIEIPAATYNNATGILLQPGITYQFRAVGTCGTLRSSAGPTATTAAKLPGSASSAG